MATDNSTPTFPKDELKSAQRAFADFMYARKGYASTTVKTMLSGMRCFTRVIGLNPTHEVMARFLAEVRRDGASYSNTMNYVKSLEVYSEFLGDPLRLARPRKPRDKTVAVLSEAEIAVIISAAKDLRQKAILALLAYSGIRNAELGKLLVRDVDIANQMVYVEGAKAEQHRNVCVGGACLDILVEYMKQRAGQPEDRLFVTARNGNPYATQDLRKLIRVTAKRAGIKKRVHPHLFRHSLATNMIHRGAHLLAVKEQLGHEHIESTMRYIHASKERLQQEYRQYVPSYV